jgi:hypothetical protein
VRHHQHAAGEVGERRLQHLQRDRSRSLVGSSRISRLASCRSSGPAAGGSARRPRGCAPSAPGSRSGRGSLQVAAHVHPLPADLHPVLSATESYRRGLRVEVLAALVEVGDPRVLPSPPRPASGAPRPGSSAAASSCPRRSARSRRSARRRAAAWRGRGSAPLAVRLATRRAGPAPCGPAAAGRRTGSRPRPASGSRCSSCTACVRPSRLMRAFCLPVRAEGERFTQASSCSISFARFCSSTARRSVRSALASRYSVYPPGRP